MDKLRAHHKRNERIKLTSSGGNLRLFLVDKSRKYLCLLLCLFVCFKTKTGDCGDLDQATNSWTSGIYFLLDNAL